MDGQGLRHRDPRNVMASCQPGQAPQLATLQVGPGWVPPVHNPIPSPTWPSTLAGGSSPSLPYGGSRGYAQPCPPPHMILPQGHPHQTPQPASGPPLHHLAGSA